MGKYDKFKAAFLPKKNLGKRVKAQANKALEDLDEAMNIATELAPNEAAAAKKRREALTSRVLDQVTIGAEKPGDAWIALGALQEEVDKELALLRLVQKQSQVADAGQQFAALLAATRQLLAAAGNGCRAISASKPRRTQKLSDELAALTKQVDTVAAAGPEQLDALRTHKQSAKDLLENVRKLAAGPGGRPLRRRCRRRCWVTLSKFRRSGPGLGRTSSTRKAALRSRTQPDASRCSTRCSPPILTRTMIPMPSGETRRCVWPQSCRWRPPERAPS